MLKDKVFWYDGKGQPGPPLDGNYTADIVVVGGGMSGLMCAYSLASAGKSVILLEKDFCGAGASGKSSGFISPDSELELSDLIISHGKEKAAALWNFTLGGVNLIRDTIRTFNIACDYQEQDCCYVASSKKDVKNIRSEHEARESLGHSSILYDGEQLHGVLNSNSFHGGVRYSDTYGINGFQFCQGLAKELRRMGVKIYEQSCVTGAGANKVRCGSHTVTADKIVLCTDRFLPDLGFLEEDLFQLQTFLAISTPLSKAAVKKIFPRDKLMVWNSKLIYHYFRITGDNRLLLGGANMLYTYTNKERHNAKAAIKPLHRFFNSKFPEVKVKWDCIWPGMIGVSKDVIPIAGQSREDHSLYFLVAATGLPWAAALGQYIAGKITHPELHPLDELFSPYRKYPVGKKMQKLTGAPLSFLLSHFMTKYFEKLV